MTPEQIIAALQPLDNFAANTTLPRGWHAQWQRMFQETVMRLQAMSKTAEGNTKPAAPVDPLAKRNVPSGS